VKTAAGRSIRWAQAGLLVNALLVLVKLIAGIVAMPMRSSQTQSNRRRTFFRHSSSGWD